VSSPTQPVPDSPQPVPGSPMPTVPGGPGDAGEAHPGIPPAELWQGWPEVRADLRAGVVLALGLALAAVPAGLLWWWLAPRADFRVTEQGPAVIGIPPSELAVADDSVFVLVLAGLGLLAGAAAWRLRRRRGVATVVGLAVGMALCAVGARQLGELLGPGPTAEQLETVGGLVTTPLVLSGVSALAVGPFAAVLAYLVAVVSTSSDGLGRRQDESVTGEARPGGSRGAATGEEQRMDAGALS
jgi:hypothetical protein